jgi:hypothetical protein
MLGPMLVAQIYTSALIFGPAFIIVLASFVALLVRFSSLKTWIGGAMVVIGIIELSLVPFWVFWVFFIGLSTVTIGAMMLAIALLRERERAWIGFIVAAVGIIVGILLVFAGDIWGFALGPITLIFGVAGSAALLPERRRVKIGLVSAAVGFILILISMFTNFFALAFFVGLEVIFGGIAVGVSGLPYWARNHSGGNIIRRLKKSYYVFLAVVIFSSALVFSLRATHILREDLCFKWSYKTTAGTTVRGVVTEFHLNYEVNNGYSYHIFPALIILNVTDVVKVGKTWMDTRELTDESEHWVNENMTVAYDKPDVPVLSVGQRVEASGYFDVPVEDLWSYSWKLVIAAEIDGSYVIPLQA